MDQSCAVPERVPGFLAGLRFHPRRRRPRCWKPNGPGVKFRLIVYPPRGRPGPSRQVNFLPKLYLDEPGRKERRTVARGGLGLAGVVPGFRKPGVSG